MFRKIIKPKSTVFELHETMLCCFHRKEFESTILILSLAKASKSMDLQHLAQQNNFSIRKKYEFQIEITAFVLQI